MASYNVSYDMVDSIKFTLKKLSLSQNYSRCIFDRKCNINFSCHLCNIYAFGCFSIAHVLLKYLGQNNDIDSIII